MQLTHAKLLKIFRVQFFVKWHFQYICLCYSITLHEIWRPAKLKEQPFRGVPSQIIFKDFAKILKLFLITFLKFRRSCFQETSLSGCFQSYYYSFFVFFHFYTCCSFHESYLRTLSSHYAWFTNCLSVFDSFVKFALKGLTMRDKPSLIRNIRSALL